MSEEKLLPDKLELWDNQTLYLCPTCKEQYRKNEPYPADLRAIDEAIVKVEDLIKESNDSEWEMGLTEALEAMQQIRAKYEGK